MSLFKTVFSKKNVEETLSKKHIAFSACLLAGLWPGLILSVCFDALPIKLILAGQGILLFINAIVIMRKFYLKRASL